MCGLWSSPIKGYLVFLSTSEATGIWEVCFSDDGFPQVPAAVLGQPSDHICTYQYLDWAHFSVPAISWQGWDQFSISYKIPLSTYFGLSEIACWSVLCVACHWVCIYMNIYTEHSIYGFCLSFVIYDEKFGQISISQQLRSSHYPSSPAGPP